jgi:two-component system, chemotaxis family, sensor kinase Cph1
MIHRVFLNLLSNAMKFTSAIENPIIEVGGCVEGEENIYYVSDNDVGFNVQCANKLFGVFQRMPRQDGFEGTECELALV